MATYHVVFRYQDEMEVQATSEEIAVENVKKSVLKWNDIVLDDDDIVEVVCYDDNDDYIENYRNADEIEPYGVNPLDYEK